MKFWGGGGGGGSQDALLLYETLIYIYNIKFLWMVADTKSGASAGLVENLSDDPYSTTSNPSLDHSFTDLGTQEHGHHQVMAE